mmetsp:Transcript_27826/g.59504  ORF Transcript_27826/g.59504 Transcript_27826/m.59504 type:complete len:202 (+) Transcript_27826:602-1207(+)
MDGISVKNNIHEVEATSTQLFFTKRAGSSCPIEPSNDRFLDFQQVVNSLSCVNIGIGSILIRSKRPDFSGLSDIPAEVIGQLTSKCLIICLRVHNTIFDSITKFTRHGFSFKEQTVMLVGRLGQTSNGGLGLNSFTVRDNGIRDLNLCSHEIILKILQTNFQVKLSRSSNDVFTGFTGTAYNHGIGLGQSLHTLNQLRKIS